MTVSASFLALPVSLGRVAWSAASMAVVIFWGWKSSQEPSRLRICWIFTTMTGGRVVNKHSFFSIWKNILEYINILYI